MSACSNVRALVVYMVLEYVANGAVLPAFDASNPVRLTSAAARKHMRDAIHGLEYLHFHSVVHFDIKPENLLLDETGTLKICDFGVSHLLNHDGQIVGDDSGSPAFQSPEKLSGKLLDNQAAAVDVWALGITLFIMIYGFPPFLGNTVDQTYHLIQEEPLRVPDLPDVDSSVFLEDLLHRMLDKDPSARISLEEMMRHPWLVVLIARCSLGLYRD
jgi:serine/threonine protein kinase